MASQTSDQLVSTLRHTIIALVQRDGPDLSSRQLSVLLICYLEDGPHTVRGLSERLATSKPAITRALDRLSEFNLLRRKGNPNDRRSVNMQRTMNGAAFLRDLRVILSEADTAARQRISLIPAAVKKSPADNWFGTGRELSLPSIHPNR
jgi:DNA-binding MarR family transcriptional regulator